MTCENNKLQQTHTKQKVIAKNLPEEKLRAFLFEKSNKKLILTYKNENPKFEVLQL